MKVYNPFGAVMEVGTLSPSGSDAVHAADVMPTILVVLEATQVERRLIEAAQAGRELDVSEETDREVRAGVLRDLLRERCADALDPRGVRLRGARVVGELDLADVRASVPLILNACVHDQPIVLNRAHLPHLNLSDGTFPMLDAGDLVCEHDVQVRRVCCGHVNLIGAHVAGQLNLDGAQARSCNGPALNAERLTVGNGLFLTENFVASSNSVRGSLCFLGASITGPFELDGARIEATNGPALNADWITVTGSVFLNDGFVAGSDCERGTLRVQGATITGQLNLNQALVRNATDAGAGVVAIGARVGADFVMPMQVLAPGQSGSVLVNVNGLHYPAVPRGATYREWLTLLAKHTPTYAAQPYQQLAGVHRAAGHDQEARQILIAQQRDLRRRGELGGRWRKLLHVASGIFIGYGHRPFRALGFLAGVCGLAGAIVLAASLLGVIVKAGPGGGACSPAEGFGMAVDTAVPVLRKSGAKSCEIATTTHWGQAIYVARYFLQVLGWAFATLFVAGYTGLVRKTT